MQFKTLVVGGLAVALFSGMTAPAVADAPVAVTCDRPTFSVNQITYAPASPFRVGLGNTKAVVTPSVVAKRVDAVPADSTATPPVEAIPAGSTVRGGCEVKKWSYVLYGENGAVAQLNDYTSDSGTITVREAKLKNRDAGDQVAKVTATYGPAEGYTGTTKRNQSWQVDADLYRRGTFGSSFKAPTSVAVGGQATITAKLSRANWDTDKYGKYAGQNVVLQVRTSYSAPWGKLITRKTDANGRVTFKTIVEEDTLVRVFYFGNVNTSHAVSGEILVAAV